MSRKVFPAEPILESSFYRKSQGNRRSPDKFSHLLLCRISKKRAPLDGISATKLNFFGYCCSGSRADRLMDARRNCSSTECPAGGCSYASRHADGGTGVHH